MFYKIDIKQSSKSKNKDIFEKNSISYSKEPRIDVLTLYYYSVNLLLLNNYKKITFASISSINVFYNKISLSSYKKFVL